MCNRSDNVFGSSSVPGSVEMPKTRTNKNATGSLGRATTFVTMNEDGRKRYRSKEEEQSLVNKIESLEQPPKKKARETTSEETEDEDQNSERCGEISVSYTDKDVLSGRGGGTNLHPGNRFYRDLILSHRASYDEASKTMKPEISRQIVLRIKERGGRFLRKDSDGLYYEIAEAEAKAKTSQALRHRTFELRNTNDPDRVKMNGRWKQTGNDSTKSSSPTTSSSGKNDRRSPMGAVYMLPSLVEKVQNSFIETPTASRSIFGIPFDSSLARERAIMQGNFHRQRLIEATVNPPASSSCIQGDTTYMTAIANLRHREAMLNLDRAIHEAEKRRCTSFPYPSPFSSSFAAGLPGSASLPDMTSVHHPYGIGNLTRGLSIGSTSSLGSSFHGRALLHSRPVGSDIHLKGDIRDRVALHPGVLSVRDIPFSSSLTSRSSERIAEMERLLKSHTMSQCMDRTDGNNPKSPR